MMDPQRDCRKSQLQAPPPKHRIRTAGEYTFRTKARTFMRAAASGRNPLYAVAEEGIFGGFEIPQALELKYVNLISAWCGRKGPPDSKAIGRLIDVYLFAGIEYIRVLKSLKLGGEFDANSASFMHSNYLELAGSVDGNPGLFRNGRAECFLGRIAGYAKNILELGIPMPEEQERSLRMILSAHTARFGAGIPDSPEPDAEKLVWAVLPYDREEYTAARRMKAFMSALIRLRNPLLEVAKEGFFGEYELDSRTRKCYYDRIAQGYRGEKLFYDLDRLLFLVHAYENVYAFKRISPAFIGDGMSSLALQIAGGLKQNASVLGQRLSAALMRKVAGLAENIMHEADAVPGGSHGHGDMELAKIISRIRCRE